MNSNYCLFRVIISLVLLFLIQPALLKCQVWQWSAEVKSVTSAENNRHPRAFLWVPEDCRQIRGVVFGQHNMLEEGILEHSGFRKVMSDLGFAEIWVSPMLNMEFNFTKGAGPEVDDMMKSLADVSGYKELEYVPIVPIGHSAAATFPWNFAAKFPQRTLAILSIHGDAPATNLTGFGRQNADWSNANIDGIPGLMVMGEYEWWDDRMTPALDFRQKHPQAAISMLADAGHGHFDYSDELVRYLAFFVKKAAYYRLPKDMPLDKPVTLKPIDPAKGWLADRWHKTEKPYASAAPYRKYKGDEKSAFWYFDKETALATEKYYARERGLSQYIGVCLNGKLLAYNPKNWVPFETNFIPEKDGVTFHLSVVLTDSLRRNIISNRGHNKPVITRICGPVKKVNDSTFTVNFYRMGFTSRTRGIWLMALSKGNCSYRSMVQQINVNIPLQLKEGGDQTIRFDSIPDITVSVKGLKLKAAATSGLPVYFYVQDGPAEVKNGELKFAKIPPRAKFPIKVTVVAWQYGRSVEPKVKSSEPVTRSFYIVK